MIQTATGKKPVNPVDRFLRMDRMPHIWCPGCGIGITVNCFARALEKIDISLDSLAIVSGIGCTGRVAGYLNFDSFHTTHGRAIPFATGLKLANPKLKVVVFSGDGDIAAIGGNHFINAARRNIDLAVICVNNFNYAMTGGQMAPTTPLSAIATTAPFGTFERPFNLPFLADSCGANYVSRWTTYHVRQVTKAMTEALTKKGFSFIEVISPCPIIYQRRNRLGDGLKEMLYYKENGEICDGCDTREVGLSFRGKIKIGKFVDRDRPSYIEAMKKHMKQVLGAKYVEYEGA